VTRVLIIDDEPSLTRLLKLMLERRGGYDVRAVNTGKAGIQATLEFRPHVVLLDLVLPDLSGGEVCAALGNTPVVFLTALVQSERSVAGRTVLAKPVKIDALVASLEAATRQSSALPDR
jgi:DNA-binding response OmpR family regulator